MFVGLLVLALYFLWAAYGAAPTSLSFLAEAPDEDVPAMPMAGMKIESATMEGMAMAGHGAGVSAMSPAAFEEMAYRFIEDLTLPDGSVRPTHEWTEAMAAREGMEGDAKAEGHGEAAEAEGAHGEAAAAEGAHGEGAEAAGEEEAIDVYLMALRFAYEPAVLRLERGVRYRFRMMSMDVNHGASIHTGFAGHIMRRPAMVLTEMEMTFSEPGEFMIYCTVYCGAGHDQMKGKIIVN